MCRLLGRIDRREEEIVGVAVHCPGIPVQWRVPRNGRRVRRESVPPGGEARSPVAWMAVLGPAALPAFRLWP